MNRLSLAATLLLGLVAAGCTAPAGVDPASATAAVDTASAPPVDATEPAAVALEGCGALDPSSIKPDDGRYDDWQGPLSGWPPQIAILESGESVESVASAQAKVEETIKVPLGRPPSGELRAVLVFEADAGHIVSQLFGPSPIEPSTTLPDFYADAGVELSQQPTTGATAQHVSGVIGSKLASIIKVGPHDAALTHGAPLETGVRPWGLYWSDGKSDYSVIGGVGAEVIVAFGRSLVCGS